MMASVSFGGWTIPLRAECALLELFGFKDQLRYMTTYFSLTDQSGIVKADGTKKHQLTHSHRKDA
jgi:hypothetical protein